MRRILWHSPKEVMRFVCGATGVQPFKDYSAIGIAQEKKIIGGVVYNNKTEAGILATIGSDKSSNWMNRAFLCAIFSYAFVQEKCHRITTCVRIDNAESIRLTEHLGFRREGLLRHACLDYTDMIVYGLIKSECRFLGGKYHAALLRSTHPLNVSQAT
jgi:RimJ/RimL family protein N-acetyltransferase